MASNADRDAVLLHVSGDEWQSVSYERLPRTDPSRAAADRVQVIGAEPPETLVFERTVNGKPLFVHIFQRERRNGARVVHVAACNVVALGISRTELASALFPNAAATRAAFVRLPLFPYEINGHRAVALSAEIADDHPLAMFGTFALFDIEGAEELGA